MADTQKIVICVRHGGFSTSSIADLLVDSLQRAFKLIEPDADWPLLRFGDFHHVRSSPFLVYAVEKLGDQAGGLYAQLKVVEIPAEVQWQIDDYDGKEWVAEIHRTWD